MKNFYLSVIFILTGSILYAQGGFNCGGMAPICTDVGLNFTANSGVDQASVTDPGNDYDCLGTQPNPSWYYLEVATSGDIGMSLSAGSDIDYIIWGPFSSLSEAQGACGSLGDQSPPNPSNGYVIDCSFDPTQNESPTITGAVAGEVFVMLITNYADVVQNITLTQTSGTGSTDCSIVTNPPCAITSFISNVGGCDFATNNYQITGSIDVSDPPNSGSLIVVDCNGNSTTVANAPFNSTTYNYTLSNLNSDGQPCSVQAYFSADPTCTQTNNYVAPVCVNNCPSYAGQSSSPTIACGNQTYYLEIENTGCDGYLQFDVVGNYGSQYGNEITWEVISTLTGNTVMSGGPGTNNGNINVTSPQLDPNVTGSVFQLIVYDSFGDGFNGNNGTIEIQQNGTTLTNAITGNFGDQAAVIVQVGVNVSTSTLTVNTPSGPITSVMGNCQDHEVGFTLANTNFCTPISVDLPWTITCDNSGTLIASGTHTVIVYPQVPSNGGDLVGISWNTTTCQWDVTPNNDCDLLDIGTVFNISPNPLTSGPYCSNGSENFTVSYTGVSGSPDCCSTAGAPIPITYNSTQTYSDATAMNSPFGGQNNSAQLSVPANGSGGNATSVSMNVSVSGYCFDPPFAQTDDDYWVTIYVDGVIIYDQLQAVPPGNFNQSFNLSDMPNGYNENSVVEVYVYPNSFSATSGGTTSFTTFNPNAICPNPGDANWTASDISLTFDATYEQTTFSAVNCDFSIPADYTCCAANGIVTNSPLTPQTIECIGDLPAPNIGLVNVLSSDCATTVTFEDDTPLGTGCPYDIERRYRVTDDCNNSVFVTQLFTVQDTQAPVFAAAPADVTVSCVGDVPAMTNLAWTDNCDGSGTVTGVDGALTGGNCGGTITRTWTYTDNCGNVGTAIQTITVNDTQVPVFAAAPASVTVSCVGDVPAMTNLSWTDNCDGAGIATGTDGALTGGNCGGTIIRTWTYTDNCGNVGTATQTITVNDTQAPVFAAAPADVTVSCIGDVPAMTNLSWTDNCDGAGIATGTDGALTGGNCGGTIIRTWTYTDNCGNVGTATQTITVNDTQAPVFAAAPGDVTVSCVGDVPAMTNLAWTDNCDGSGTVAGTDGPLTGGNCGGTIIRTWTYTDNCGNVGTATQTITVDDNLDPTASNPPTLNIASGSAPAPDITVVTDEADNCTINPVVAFVADSTDGLNCPETIYRTYSVTDDCNNQIIVTQIIIVGGGTVPIPTLSVNGPLCEGEDAVFTITGQADAIVTYNVGSGPQTTTLTGGVSTITITSSNTNIVMNLTNISDGSCSTVLNISDSVIVNPLVTPTFTQLGPYCVTGTLDALPVVSLEGITGTWSPDPVDNSAAGTFTSIFTPTVGQCANTAQMDILINAAPFIEAAATDSVICVGDSVELYISDISGGMLVETFTMTFGSAFSYTTSNTGLAGPYVAVVSGTYVGATGEIRDAYSLFQQGGVPITPLPGSPWQWNGAGASIQSVIPWGYNPAHVYNYFFNGGGPQTFSFTDSNYGDNSGSLTFEIYYLGSISWSTGSSDFTDIVYPPVGSNTYSVTVDYGGGCTSTDDVTITVNAPTPATFNQVAPICSGDAFTLPAVSNEGFTGVWSPSIDNTTTTTYTFTPDPGQCADIATMTVTVNQPTTPTFTQVGAICSGDPIAALPTTSNEGITGTWSPAMDNTQTTTYTFTPDVGQCAGSATMTITVNQPSTPTFAQVGPYCSGDVIPALSTTSNEGITGTWSPAIDNTQTTTYTFTPAAGQCATTATMTITINPPSTPSFNQVPAICEGENFIIPSTSLEGIIGAWSPVPNNTQTTTYTFTPNTGQCATNTTMTIDVNANPSPQFTVDSILGCAPLSVLFSSSNSGSLVWDFGDGNSYNGQNASNTYQNPGCYDITLTVTENGCSNTITVVDQVCVVSPPVASFTANPNVFSMPGENINFFNSSSGADTYIWNFGDGGSSSETDPSHYFSNTEEGAVVTLTAISSAGCSDQTQLVLIMNEQEIFYVPNTFTPDGDNYNQMFLPIFTSGFDPFNYELLIFNRWGELVFESHDVNIGWDGTYSAKAFDAQDGVYTWKIIYKNPVNDERKILVGHVTLMR